MEEIIDYVPAHCLEVGDLIRDPFNGAVREISGVADEGPDVHILLEDDEDPIIVDAFDEFALFGYPEVEEF